MPSLHDGARHPLTSEEAVQMRYSAVADASEPALCCPVDHDPQYPTPIPDEVIEREYACGDPSRYVGPGDTGLDLGSRSGKMAFIAAKIVGPGGRVIGVDGNDAMPALACDVCTAVGAKTLDVLTSGPHRGAFIGIQPLEPVPLEARIMFDFDRTAPRDPRETRRKHYSVTRTDGGSRCE